MWMGMTKGPWFQKERLKIQVKVCSLYVPFPLHSYCLSNLHYFYNSVFLCIISFISDEIAAVKIISVNKRQKKGNQARKKLKKRISYIGKIESLALSNLFCNLKLNILNNFVAL